VLLLIGMWIGLNWENFPANEEVFVPMVQKNTVKADTTVSTTISAETATATVTDSLKSEQGEPSDVEEINADMEEPEEEEITIPDELVTASPKPAVVLSTTNANAEHIVRKNKNLTPSVKRSQQPVPVAQHATVKEASPRKEFEPESYMSRKEIPVDNLVKVDGTYKPDASGKGVGEATFIVYNRTGKNLKKVNMEVHYLGKANQLLDKMVMPVTNIEADGSVNIKLPANIEADRLVYKVLYVSSAMGDFYYEPLKTYASAMR